MDMEEAGMQDAHNNTQELVAAPNLKEETAVRDASTTVDIVEVGMQDATMQEEEEEEEEDDIERLLADILEADMQDAIMQEEEEVVEHQVIVERLPPVITLEQWMHHFRGNNTDTTTADPYDAEAEQGANGFFESDDEDYINQDTAMALLRRNQTRADPWETRTQAPALLRPTSSNNGQLRAVPWETRTQAPKLLRPTSSNNDHLRAVPWETRTQAPALLRPTSSNNDPLNSTRQALLTSADSRAVFAGMVEGDDNGWYDSIVRDAQRMEEMEGMEGMDLTKGMEGMDMEDPGLDGISSPLLQLSKSEALAKEEPNNHHPSTKEDIPELSLQDISKIWGLHPSEFGPGEPGPSTRQPRVAPLTDDEVAKFTCGICLETLPIFDLFHGMPCPHKFCARCMDTYIEGRTRAGEVPIPCPDPACKEEGNGGGVLHPEDCKKSIDFAVFCSWSDQLTENAIPPSLRIYCPNRECRIMLESTCTNKTPSKASCPACNSIMCKACGLYWSIDSSDQHDCAEGAEAMLVKKLASERKWKQCPRCRMLVEKNMGCDVMTCRCHTVFCYDCGRSMMPLQDGAELCRCRNVH
uniref:RBR-type E3 ubiquitin transferase n=1 Tax=Setaria italica TaxID=4555 RepID=K3ZRU4_SETIT